MNNILQLCKIFHCHINDLVHEDMSDINSLDEEIIMKVAKLKEEKQKRVKGISKAVYIISKIGIVCCRIGIGVMVALLVLLPSLMLNCKMKENGQMIIFGETITYERDENQITLIAPDNQDTETITDKDIVKIANYLFNQIEDNRYVLILKCEIILLSLSATILLAHASLQHLETLFKNIHDGETPFTLDNVYHIRRLTYFMIASIVASMIGESFLNIFFYSENGVGFDLLQVMVILCLFCVSYIFEYGYEIQKDSKGVMYSEKK